MHLNRSDWVSLLMAIVARRSPGATSREIGSMQQKWLRVICLALSFWMVGPAPAQIDTRVGVYYFPGWRNNTLFAPSPRPWEPIQGFPKREPLLGWYDEGRDDVMRQHLAWMSEAGLKFVVFDWYWDVDNRVYLDHALAAYFRAPARNQMPFSIMWANHGKAPRNMDNWGRMVDFWLNYYVQRPEMLRVDGKPVVFIFLARVLDENAKNFGSTAAELLAHAQYKAKAAGLPGLYFVAGATGEEAETIKQASKTGYSAVTMYNLHRPPFVAKQSHSFSELDVGYRAHWQAYESISPVPIFFPMTSGWDKRPWGGTQDDPLHDQSMSTPNEFGVHLAAGRAAMLQGKLRPGQQTRWGLICCWNEFGEGSYIEPTKSEGKAMIQKVRSVFRADQLGLPKE